MASASKASHDVGLKFKIYNTMRELSFKAKELWALRSLEETFVSGPTEGEGSPWLQEHLQGNYLPAWSNRMDQPIDQKSDLFWSQQEVRGWTLSFTNVKKLKLTHFARRRTTRSWSRPCRGGTTTTSRGTCRCRKISSWMAFT